MDWDARGMHWWLLNISWQQEPPGTIPDDTDAIRRWLGLSPNITYTCQKGARSPSCLCPDCVWRRVRPQIMAAWPIREEDGRRFNAGLVRSAERQQKYSTSRQKAANARWGKEGEKDAHASAYAVREPCESIADEEEVDVDLDSKDAQKEKPPPGFNLTELAMMALGVLEVRHTTRPKLVTAVAEAIAAKAEELAIEPPDAAQIIVQAALEYKKYAQTQRVTQSWENWFADGNYNKPLETWSQNGTSKAADRRTRNRQNIISGLTEAGPR